MPIRKGKLMNNLKAIALRLASLEHFVVPAYARMTTLLVECVNGILSKDY